MLKKIVEIIFRRQREHTTTSLLSDNYLNIEKYDHLYSELVSLHPESQRDYFGVHKKRYYELFNAMAYYLADIKVPKVLEIGVSGFLPLYKQLFPDICLTTVDRPVELNGCDSTYAMKHCKAEHHYNVDLNKETLYQNMDMTILRKYDYIICTEIIEHLIVNPVEFLSDLISLLNSNGYLYLTTPNYFSHHNIKKMEQRLNPQHIFPKRGENWDAHHHFREYEMNELINFINEAGGDMVNFYYSDCWDDQELINGILSEHPDWKSCLVIIATPNTGKLE